MVVKEYYQALLVGCSLGVLLTVIYNQLIPNSFSCKQYPRETPKNYISPADYSRLMEEPGDTIHPSLPKIPSKPHGPIIFNDLQTLHHKGG